MTRPRSYERLGERRFRIGSALQKLLSKNEFRVCVGQTLGTVLRSPGRFFRTDITVFDSWSGELVAALKIRKAHQPTNRPSEYDDLGAPWTYCLSADDVPKVAQWIRGLRRKAASS